MRHEKDAPSEREPVCPKRFGRREAIDYEKRATSGNIKDKVERKERPVFVTNGKSARGNGSVFHGLNMPMKERGVND